MIDIKRIRERAADWLGDVGGAAIGLASRGFQWGYFRSTGDVWSISQRTIGLAPSLRWAFTGRSDDARRVGSDIGEAFARGVREAAGTSPPAGQAHAPHPPGGEQAVDGAPCAVTPMAEIRNGELTCPCGDILVEGSWPWPPGGRCLYCCTCRSSYEIGTMRELRVGDAPREVNAEGYAGNMQACDACDGPAAEPSDGPTLVHDQNRWRRAADGFVWTVRAVLEDGAYQMVREGDRDAAGPTLIVSPVELTHERLWRLEPRPAVKPPHNAAPGALGEARGADALGALNEKFKAEHNDPAPALSAEVEEQRLSHGGCTRLPREMLDALGVKDGDLLWFLRSTPGGRWEAWTAPELDEEFCIGQELGPEHVAARKAAVDAMPHHVASRLTAGEARRLEARGWTAHVAWISPAEDGAWHESDADDLARLREEAAPEATCSAAAPSTAAEQADIEPETPAAADATPPVASAAERVPESPSGGAPWRGLEHRAAQSIRDWHVTALTNDGEVYIANFSGHRSEERAREYAALMSDPARLPFSGLPCDGCGKPASTGRCFACTVALQGTDAARAALVDAAKRAANPDDWDDAQVGLINVQPPALPKPDAVRVGQRWRAVDFTHDVRVTAVNSGLVHVAVVDGPTGTVPESFMLRLDAWSYLGMAKPSRVEVGQRWRCVGVDWELVVRWLYEDGVSVRLGPAEDEASGKVVARIVDMLGLREWSYLGGAR